MTRLEELNPKWLRPAVVPALRGLGRAADWSGDNAVGVDFFQLTFKVGGIAAGVGEWRLSHSGAQLLAQEAVRRRNMGGGLYLSQLRAEPQAMMQRCGVLEEIGAQNIFGPGDDVLGELDDTRRRAFWEQVGEAHQVIATGTVPPPSGTWLTYRVAGGAYVQA